MEYLDFMYDGQYLSDYGFMIAQITKTDNRTIVNTGSKITFNKSSRNGGKRYTLESAQYNDTFTTTFEICKNINEANDIKIASDEYRDLIRWLNRREYLQFCFVPEDGDETEKYYNASFNVEKILVNGYLIGLRLTLETDAPFGYGQEQQINYNVSDTSVTFTLSDVSDEVGYTYPYVEIEILRNGDFVLYNQTLDEKTEVKNCRVGEILYFKGNTLITETSDDEHENRMSKDFNFVSPRISNTIDNRQNKFKFSLPCKVKIKYTPIIK